MTTIEEVEPRARKKLDPARLEQLAYRLLVIDDEPKMARRVGAARTAVTERQELVAHIEERHPGLALDAPQLENRAIERDRLLEIADLERDVVDPDQMR